MLKKCPFLFILLAVGMASAAAHTSTTPNQDDKGCYLISDADELYGFAKLVNAGNATACGKLDADIVVNTNVLGTNNANVNTWGRFTGTTPSDTWTPIGTSSTPFQGSFDGQGHTISGLYFYQKSENFGLFGYIGGNNIDVTIKDLNISDSYFGGNVYVGSLVGHIVADGELTIENVSSGAAVYSHYDDGTGYIGGLIGYVENATANSLNLTITGVHNDGLVIGKDHNSSVHNYVGGLVGGTSGLVSVTVANSFNTGNITGSSYVGGLIGGVKNPTSNAGITLNITNAYNTGTINGSSRNNIGGLVGRIEVDYSMSSVEIRNCYNYGSVDGFAITNTSTTTLGQISFTPINCYYLAEESNGFGMSANDFADGTVFALLRSGEDGEVWYQYDGDVYPDFTQDQGKTVIPAHVATLHYSENEIEKIPYVEGEAKALPSTHQYTDATIFQGWFNNQNFTGDAATEIPADANTNLNFYAKTKTIPVVDGCYQISDADMLFKFADLVNNQNSTYGSAKAKLTADIVVNQNVLGTDNANVNADGSYKTSLGEPANVWTPIGTSSTSSFKGTFNGQGHTISGLYFNDSSVDNVGLFGYTSGAVTIDNVGVVDSYFRGDEYVGGLVGYHNKQGLSNLSVKNSYNTGSVTGTDYVGGLVGGNNKNLSIVVENSYNTGSVNGSSNVGGLVGMNGDIYFSYNTGSVTGTKNVGGLLGSGGKIIDCYNTGFVKEGDGAGNAMKGYGCVQSISSDMNNSFYLEGSGNSCGPSSFSGTTEEFANGYVALELHSNTAATGAGIWGQVVGTDKTPTLTGEIRFLLKDGCFEIASKEDLYLFAAVVNKDFDPDACGKLTADIKVNENVLANVNADGSLKDGVNFKEWTPIGNWDNPFQGTFHGQGHTISGLYFNDTEAEDVGLFGDVSGTVTIDGVGLVDSYIMAGSYVGGLVGFARGSLTISDSYNASSVNTPGGSGFGGLVGAASESGSSLIISNSYNIGSLNGRGFGGGLVGYADALAVSNSYNAGSVYVSGDDAYVGGITSSVDETSTITNCFNYGTISAANSKNKDDLVAAGGEGSVTLTNCYSIGESKLFEGKGATQKSAIDFADGTVFAALRNAEDGEVWRQYAGDDYPTLVAKTGTGAPAPMHVAVLHYSETDSVVIAYTEGTAFTLPAEDKEGNVLSGWTTSADGTGDVLTEIPATATTDLKLYAKVETFKPNAEGFYEIATADDLYKFAEIVNDGTVPDAKAKLVADIAVNEHVLADANGVSKVDSDGAYIGADSASFRKWTPIGNSTNKFQGTFDGQGHTISGLYVNEPQACSGECPNRVNIGLFGAVANATEDGTVFIRNVGVEDSYFAGNSHIGGIVGDFNSEGNLNIENSYSVATIYAAGQSGGLAGYIQNTNVKIEDSYSYGNFKCNSECGALVGTDYSLTMDVANSYYLEGVKSKFGTAASSDAFANGTVATLLHGDGTGANSLWGQNVTDGESHPTFFKGINVVGPGVIAGGPETSTITLLYPDATDSSFTYVEGWGASLPEKDKNGDYVIWYDGSGNFYNEISSTVSGDLVLHAVVFKPGNDGFYEIDDVAKLYKFAAIVNGGNGDVNAKLTADIEVNKNVLATAGGKPNVDATTGAYTGNTTGLREWTPIGYCDENLNCLPFTGIFDGQGHTISGLYYNDENANEVGLFGYVEGDGSTIIKNVGVEDSYFKALDIAGGILGEYGGENAASIENVYSAAVVVAGEDARAGIGGVVGTAWYGDLTVTNAYNVGSVIGGGSMGGIVGDIEECSATIKNSFNYGNVAGEPLVGSVDGEDVSVTNSYYLADEVSGSYGSNASASDFENGTVLAALRDGEGGYVWVQAEGDKYPTIDVNASTNAKTIVLDWTSAADSTTLDAAGYTDGAMVIVKDGKQFYAGGAIYEGILSAGQVAAIGSNKLYPISGVELETVDGKLVATLDGDSDESLLIPTDVQVDTVVYKRNVMANTFTTVMLPFSVPATSVENHSFYKFKRVADDPVYTYAVKVSSVTGTLKANRPYIMIDSEGSTQIKFNVSGEKLVLNTTAESYDASSTYDGITWTMRGMFKYKQWLEGDSELGPILRNKGNHPKKSTFRNG